MSHFLDRARKSSIRWDGKLAGREWSAAYPRVPIMGAWQAQPVQRSPPLLKDGERPMRPSWRSAMKQGLLVRPLVSQGCRPIGEPSPITTAEQNLIYGDRESCPRIKPWGCVLSIPAEQRVSFGTIYSWAWPSPNISRTSSKAIF